MPKISMLLPIYNEGILLKYSLENTIKYMDEIIIVDGGPHGPSTDNSKQIIDAFDRLYPGKIKYYTGIFRMENGSWDESAHRNYGLSKVTGDFLMAHCGDMIYPDTDIYRMIEAINKYPDKRIVYCLFVEFWLDQTQIRMYGGHAMEAWYPVLAVSDIPFVRMDLIKKYQNGPHLLIEGYTQKDFMFIHNAFRYHYGWISGFHTQVNKHIRNMAMGAWGEVGKPIFDAGEKAIVKWAINHVLSYKDMGCGFVFTSDPPIDIDITYLDGYEDVIQKYKTIYGDDLLND